MVNPRTLSTRAISKTTRHLLAIGMLTLLASAPTLAVAAPSAPEFVFGKEQATNSDDLDVARQIELFRTAQVSLSRAIEIAERAHAAREPPMSASTVDQARRSTG